MEPENQQVNILGRRISRRSTIKAGGIAALGLAFGKPVIQTLHPRPAFAQLSPVADPIAQVCTIDQQNTPVGSSLTADLRLGRFQGFQPALASPTTPGQSLLCKVQLRFANISTPTSVSINIRQGTPTGIVLGSATAIVLVPAGVNFLADFVFATPIPLVIGNLYQIETLPIQSTIVILGQATDTYSPGIFTTFLQGGALSPRPNNDLDFNTFALV